MGESYTGCMMSVDKEASEESGKSWISAEIYKYQLSHILGFTVSNTSHPFSLWLRLADMIAASLKTRIRTK
ncbi:hypothetical protein DFQ30_007336 [Apophysomyces sp. BC1015]|nr:hypothetical protein DFQ30_007336 [Apophysomyces sp. BC1015]